MGYWYAHNTGEGLPLSIAPLSRATLPSAVRWLLGQILPIFRRGGG